MIEELDIRNLVIISHLRVDFASGMTVLTGETGAGKSIIIDALNLLTGGRSSKRLIRNGHDSLALQGLARFPKGSIIYQKLDALGIDHADGNVIFRRKVYRSGRNVCRINGTLVNTSTLRQVGRYVVDIQGQNAHQVLADPRTHLHLLDAFAGDRIMPVLSRFRRDYDRYVHLKRSLDARVANRRAWIQHLDMLKFQIKDIKHANLKPHEDVHLVNRRNQLKHHQNISEALKKSYLGINGDGNFSPLDMIGDAMNAMQSVAEYGPQYARVAKDLQNHYYALQDDASQLNDLMTEQDYSPHQLDSIEARLSLIDQLKQKYGNSVSSVLNYYSKLTKELHNIQDHQSHHGDEKRRLENLRSRLLIRGRQLSQLRHRVARHLETAVHRQLTSLYMSSVAFKVKFTVGQSGQFFRNGLEKVEFYVRTNPGEDLVPLADSASGGELSRIMLALKTVFTQVQDFGSVVFDEIDTGVSGRVAQAIAAKMVKISRNTQVMCITHLPQVAAMGDHQYLVQKHVRNGQTRTSLRKLDLDGRTQEVARMLAGKKVTRLAQAHARELLNLANQAKNG